MRRKEKSLSNDTRAEALLMATQAPRGSLLSSPSSCPPIYGFLRKSHTPRVSSGQRASDEIYRRRDFSLAAGICVLALRGEEGEERAFLRLARFLTSAWACYFVSALVERLNSRITSPGEIAVVAALGTWIVVSLDGGT